MLKLFQTTSLQIKLPKTAGKASAAIRAAPTQSCRGRSAEVLCVGQALPAPINLIIIPVNWLPNISFTDSHRQDKCFSRADYTVVVLPGPFSFCLRSCVALGQLIWHKDTAIPLDLFSGRAPAPRCPCHKENGGEKARALH